jgi:hypothetical protein
MYWNFDTEVVCHMFTSTYISIIIIIKTIKTLSSTELSWLFSNAKLRYQLAPLSLV